MNRTKWLAAGLAALVLAAPAAAEHVLRHGPDIDRIKNWKAPDSKTLIIETYGKRTYEVKFRPSCFGLRNADTIAFVTRGTDDLDNFSSIILPDGTRCLFDSVTPVTADLVEAKDESE